MGQASPDLTMSGTKLTQTPKLEWLFVPTKELHDIALPQDFPQLFPVSPQQCFTCAPRLVPSSSCPSLLDTWPHQSQHCCFWSLLWVCRFLALFWSCPLHCCTTDQLAECDLPAWKGKRHVCTSESPGDLVKIQVLTQCIWGGTRDCAFLPSLQVMVTLLVHGPHFEYWHVEDICSGHSKFSIDFGYYDFHTCKAPGTGPVILPKLWGVADTVSNLPTCVRTHLYMPHISSCDYPLLFQPWSKIGPHVRQARDVG